MIKRPKYKEGQVLNILGTIAILAIGIALKCEMPEYAKWLLYTGAALTISFPLYCAWKQKCYEYLIIIVSIFIIVAIDFAFPDIYN